MWDLQVCPWFGVVENLAVDVLLVTTYMDSCMKEIFPTDKRIVPMKSASETIVGRMKDHSKIKSVLSHKTFWFKAQEHVTIRVAQQLTGQAKKSPVGVET